MILTNKEIRKGVLDKCGIYRTSEHTVITVKYKGKDVSVADLMRTTSQIERLKLNIIGVKQNSPSTISFTTLN